MRLGGAASRCLATSCLTLRGAAERGCGLSAGNGNCDSPRVSGAPGQRWGRRWAGLGGHGHSKSAPAQATSWVSRPPGTRASVYPGNDRVTAHQKQLTNEGGMFSGPRPLKHGGHCRSSRRGLPMGSRGAGHEGSSSDWGCPRLRWSSAHAGPSRWVSLIIRSAPHPVQAPKRQGGVGLDGPGVLAGVCPGWPGGWPGAGGRDADVS